MSQLVNPLSDALNFRDAVRGPLSALSADIRSRAHEIHRSVNQLYDKVHPYGLHLDMVAESVVRYGDGVITSPEDYAAIWFAAYFHDTIEDARLTYNDVMAIARQYLTPDKAMIATEAVYALTNDKGRTRAERAGEAYYRLIRSTPYAPLVKAADRLANVTYSYSNDDDCQQRMRRVYASEMDHFIGSLTTGTRDAVSDTDTRLRVPAQMIDRLVFFSKQS